MAKDSKHVQCILDVAEDRKDSPVLNSSIHGARNNPAVE